MSEKKERERTKRMTCSEITDCYPPQVSTSMEKIDKDRFKT